MIELKKCGKAGCDVRPVKSGCCDYVVPCNKCGLGLSAPTSEQSIAEVWEQHLDYMAQETAKK